MLALVTRLRATHCVSHVGREGRLRRRSIPGVSASFTIKSDRLFYDTSWPLKSHPLRIGIGQLMSTSAGWAMPKAMAQAMVSGGIACCS